MSRYSNNELLFRPLIIQDRNFNNKYYLQMIGILDDSNKIIINLSDIEVYFDVQVNNEYEKDLLKSVLRSNKYKNWKIIEMNSLIGYQINKNKYARIFFDNLYDRKKMLDELNCLNTYSNDIKNYYRKVSREYKLRLTSWNKLYNVRQYGKYYYTSINNFIYKEDQNIQGKFKIFAWDIESWSGRGLGDLPQGKYEEDEVFLICVCLFQEGEINPYKKICITTQESDYEIDWEIYTVEDQKQLILTFARIIYENNPDIEIGFNSSGYDWPFLIQKIDMFKIFDEFFNILEGVDTKKNRIRQFYIKTGKIKITSDESIEYEYIKIPNCISIDIRIALKKIMSPKKPESSSLKYFLSKYNQPDKIDLEHHILWKFYSDAKFCRTSLEESKRNMYTILKYCINDAWSCQRLLISSGLLENYKKISDIAYVS